jgi:hypothetical protein
MELQMNILSSRLNRIRAMLMVFMIGLVFSGLTAIPLEWEVEFLKTWFGSGSWLSDSLPDFSSWMDRIYDGVTNGYGSYPFLAYGTDWLAFGHVAIATAFIGPWRDPVRNLWVIEFGMLACLLVVPWTLVFAPLRGIPSFWMLIDMSFGAFGMIPLWFARRETLKLAGER